MSSKRITLHRNSEITGLAGDTKLRSVTWKCISTGEMSTKQVENMFVMIGAVPRTELLRAPVFTDPNGFILTGPSAGNNEMPYGTSVRGVFAVGDVRSGSVKRVASAVGEGSVVVAMIHTYLAGIQ